MHSCRCIAFDSTLTRALSSQSQQQAIQSTLQSTEYSVLVQVQKVFEWTVALLCFMVEVLAVPMAYKVIPVTSLFSVRDLLSKFNVLCLLLPVHFVPGSL